MAPPTNGLDQEASQGFVSRKVARKGALRKLKVVEAQESAA